MEKAIAYIRVSTEEQAREGVSLAAQEEKIIAYCTITGLELVAIIREEGVSAGKPLASRPGGKKLLKMITNQEIKNVIAIKLDRLFRDASNCLEQTKAWDNAGIALHLLDMGGQSVNTSSALGRMFITLTAAFAELERNLISERTKTAMAHKKTHREAYGHTPYGFNRVGNNLIVDAQEQKTVSSIKAWKNSGWSLRNIAEELNRQGIPTKRGGRWYASTIRYLLQNDLYKEVI